MKDQDTFFRPPAESDSLLIQVMRGCSHNHCTFCNMFTDVPFEILPQEEVFEELNNYADDISSKFLHKITSIYMVGGDSVIIPTDQLLKILKHAKKRFPYIERVACYSTARAIIIKGPKDLKKLQAAGLKHVYVGLESGSDEILKSIKKGCTRADLIKAAENLREADIKNEVTLMLGIGGREKSEEHALKTADLINIMQPAQVSLTTYGLKKGTELGNDYLEGKFELMEPKEILNELKLLTEKIAVPLVLNGKHWLNFIFFKHNLPEEKEELMEAINQAMTRHHSDFRSLGITEQKG